MHPAASVLWLRDQDGEFPIAQLQGDTDGETLGWLPFVSTKFKEVVLVEVSPDEWNDTEAGSLRALDRIRQELCRPDILSVKLLRVERPRSPKGISFQAFLEAEGEAVQFYSSRTGGGEARVERRQSLAAFRQEGGSVLVCPYGARPTNCSDAGAA